MQTEPETRRFTKNEVLAIAGDWMLLAGPDGEQQYATKVAGLDPADCPAALLMARATGKAISPMARELLTELGDAGNHVIALCVIEDYFAKVRGTD